LRTRADLNCWHTVGMHSDPTVRALRLLSLLQSHRFWLGAELADRLEVTQRTVRRDIDRLRELGYPVDALPGKYGGYRLAAGAHVPPLILDDDEAVAVTIGLRLAALAAIDGIEETSLRALTKIELLLPSRLRRRVSALHSSLASVRRSRDDADDLVDPEALSLFAAACRDREHVRFDYRTHDGPSRRTVEPHRLVTANHRWYLLAWDHDRDDWRTFRVDRVRGPRVMGNHFAPREFPGGDAASFVAESIGEGQKRIEARLIIHAAIDEVEAVLRWIDHSPIETEHDHCVVKIRGEDLGRLAMAVARLALTAPVTVVEPVELAETVAQLASHLDARSEVELG
jgi:predicted DNA-binding transcriptional regulator YafY